MAVTIQRYDSFPLGVADGSIDIDTDTWYVALMTSAHSFATANSVFTTISANQVVEANGYIRYTSAGSTGRALSSVVLSQSGSTVTFDAGDIIWSAAGGNIAAEHAVIVNGTATSPNDRLAWNVNFGQTETAGTGTTFKITWNSSGIFTIT